MKIYGFDDSSVLKSGSLLSRRICSLQSIDLNFNLSTPTNFRDCTTFDCGGKEYCDIFTTPEGDNVRGKRKSHEIVDILISSNINVMLYSCWYFEHDLNAALSDSCLG
jgi:hypothetical protein